MATLTAQFVSIPEEGATYTITITSASIPTDGTLTLSNDPLHIVMPQPDDKYPGVRTLEAEIKVLTKESMAYLYSDTPLNTSVTIKRNNATVFYGFLEPSQWQQPMVPGEWNDVEIVAMDALAALKNVPFYERTLMCFLPDDYGTTSLFGLLKQHCGSDITISYQTWKEAGTNLSVERYMKGYFSSEAFIGTDVEDAEAHTFIGDMLQGYARALGITLMMRGKTLYCYRADYENKATGLGDIKAHINDTNIDMEIVPPVRTIEGKWDEAPEIEEPKAYRSPNYVDYSYDIGTHAVAISADANWEAEDWPSDFQAFGTTNRPALFSTATDNSNRSSNNTSMFPGVGAIEKEDKVHVRVPYVHVVTEVLFQSHINRERGTDAYKTNRMSLVPDDVNNNTWDEKDVSTSGASGPVYVKVGNTLYGGTMSSVDHTATSSGLIDLKWGLHRFRFATISDVELIKAKGKMRLGIRSTARDAQHMITPRYIKDIRYFNYIDHSTLLRTVPANSSPMLESLDIDTPLSAESSYSVGAIGFAANAPATPTYFFMKDQLAVQYRDAHPQYTGDFKATAVMSGYITNLTRHYQFLGKWHTPMSFDWDCRNNNIELIMLEDHDSLPVLS